jgi:hypothetical protein
VRYAFIVTAGAKEDMVACRAADPRAATTLSVLLREIIDDVVLCEELFNEREAQAPIINVAPLMTLQSQRINAYRVKVIDAMRWRLITGVDHGSKRVGLFAVMARDQDYQSDRTLWARIEREYDGNHFARY